jgi:hypothetical protein
MAALEVLQKTAATTAVVMPPIASTS